MKHITNLSDFYKTDEWETFLRILADERANDDGDIICAHCGKPIVRKYDRIGHHVEHLTLANVNDVTVSLNPVNVVFVHHRCHNEIHKRFGFGNPQVRRVKKVYVVYGSPCSGKTTFVHEVADAGDLIVDMDAIWQCISAQDGDGHFLRDDRLRANAFKVRDCMLDMVKTRYGDWNNAYIIGGYPLIAERERLGTIYGAEFVHIDTPRDVCLLRAEGRPKEWTGFIEDYWNKFQAGA